MERFDVLVVGGGQGGAQIASTLRQQQYAGTIAIVSDEADAPYERPALSKEYLAGEKTFEKMLLRPISAWEGTKIELRLGKRVTEIDSRAHVAKLEDGTPIGYGTLVWSAGGAPRKLSCTGHDWGGVHAIRSRADVDRLKNELETKSTIVVIGGGYIGLEAAAVLSKLGKRVTIVEAQDRVLSRVAGAELSRFYEDEHRKHGVDLRFHAKVDAIDATGVHLEGGDHLPAEIVIVGIGITPTIEPLRAAGATTDAKECDGVLVDLQCRTSLPDVFAIGDCAAHPNVHAGGRTIRLESIQNANDQAAIVAKTICGKSERYEALPTFWSNQWDLKLQTIGLAHGHDATIIRGNLSDRKFSIVYLFQGRVIALDCVNAMKDYVQARALIASGRTFDANALRDKELKSL
jgi:3-phenylpropionate/trans-cinnamate dioxygenase ferredoxin reductase subunit